MEILALSLLGALVSDAERHPDLPALEDLLLAQQSARAEVRRHREASGEPRWYPADDHPVRKAIVTADRAVESWLEGHISDVDRFVVAFSGGKDSVALVCHLLDLGVDRSRIELWHHDVDGNGRNFFDWPCTRGYCERFAAALGLPIFSSWRVGGFEREMLRDATSTAPVAFEVPGGALVEVGGRGPPGTRRMFPQQSADLSVRWCSSYLKIDVAARVFSNDPRFQQGFFVLLTGERAQESAARARYAVVDAHRSQTRRRRVLSWRAVHDWPEERVWETLARHRVRPHPAYRLGFGRVSCRCCIFGNDDQWATIAMLDPGRLQEVAALEREFGKTIKRGMDVEQRAARGRCLVPADQEILAREVDDPGFSEPALLLPGESWVLPAGAYRETGGPI